MAMQFNGEFVVNRKPDEVYDFLTDPKRFSPLLPEYEGMTQEDETHFTVKVRVGISHIRGTAEVKMHLAEALRPTRALYKGQGKVVGGSATLTASFDLEEPPEGGTKVKWNGEAQVFGPLTSIAGGLLQPVAKKNLEKLVSGLHQALADQSQVAGTQAAQSTQPAGPEHPAQAANTGGPIGQR